jgi:hypothetical protein
MVSTRRSPEKTPPAGVPTRRWHDLSRQGQQGMRSEQQERRQHRVQASVAAVGAREGPAPTPPPTPPPPPSAQSDSSAVVAAVDFANALDFSVAEEEEQDVEDEVEEEQGGGVQGGGDVLNLSRKSKLAMHDNELYTYFLNRLSGMSCPNKKCDCLAILQSNEHARRSVAMYLSWFERRTKHEQDSIVFEWWRYVLILRPSIEQRKGLSRRKAFRLPYFVGDHADADISIKVKSHLVCRGGLNTLLNFGQKRYLNLRNAAMSSAVLPEHKRIGITN